MNKPYIVVCCDTIYLNVRRNRVSKEAVHILVGITQKGMTEVHDYCIFPQESSENYRDMLYDMQSSGAQEILVFVSDGLTGLKDVCLEVYPQAMHQSCWVHVQHNIARLVRAKDRKEILDLLKPVYQASNQLEALNHINSQISHR